MTTAEALAAALTTAQRTALEAVSPRSFDTAAELGVSASALSALERKGLVDVRIPRHLSSNPRARVDSEYGAATYRITGYGVVVLRKARALPQQTA